MFGRRREQRERDDARAEAVRWYERLGGQIMNLPPGSDPATKQALVDAAERYNAAGAQLERAESPRQFALARETAVEGLNYIRAARVAMGFDPGPALPALETQRGVGAISAPRAVEVDGRQYRAAPQAGGDTPYYYPGGRVQGRPVPSGWYSEPWWKTALATGAGVVGGMLLFDALAGGFSGGGYDQGYEAGREQGYDQGYDAGQASDGSQGDGSPGSGSQGDGDPGQGDAGAGPDGGDYGGAGDYSDYDAGGFDGGYDPGFDGGFDGGDFGGGDFGGDF